jgi:hypothetical protein
MHKIDHAAILFAYLSRITHADIENILERDKACLHAAMNLGNSAQLSAQAGMYAAVANAVNNLIEHDVALIDKTLKGFKPNI